MSENKKYSMSLKELLSGFIDIEDKKNCLLSSITNDSREVKKGSLFLAYPGYTVDGRGFISQAIEKKAAAILYEPSSDLAKTSDNPHVPMIPFSSLSTRQGELAAKFYQYPSQHMPVIGVTGTNGKTSITRFIAQTLGHEFPCAVMGSTGVGFLSALQSSHLTTVDAVNLQRHLAYLKKQGAHGVAMEVSSHALSQERVNGVDFHTAIYTQLSQDHLDFHGDMENYAHAKAKLFDVPSLRYRVINQDDKLGKKLIERHKKSQGLMAYSLTDHKMDGVETLMAKIIKPVGKGYEVFVTSPWGEGKFVSPLLGKFNISNLLATLCVLVIFNVPFDEALRRVSKVTPVPGRLESFGGTGLPLVINDYSHTPDALEKALSELREHCKGRLWCVFGCGGDRDKGKRPHMGRIAQQYSDEVIITNDNPRSEEPQAIASDICAGLDDPERAKIILDRSVAIKYAVQSASINDIVLIAGKGCETTQTIGDKVLPFSDKEQIERFLTLKKRGKN